MNIVFTSFPSLLFPPVTHCLSLSQIHDFFNCYCHTYTCVCIIMYICTTSWVYLVLLICSCVQCQPHGIIMGHIPGESRFSLSYQPSTACSSSSMSRTLWKLLSLPWHATGVFISRVLYRWPCDWDVCGRSFLVKCRRYHVAADILALWSLPSFCSLFYDIPWTLGLEITTQIYQLGFGTPWPCSLCILNIRGFL